MEASPAMAEIISQNSLRDIRANPWHDLREWYDGRASAAALIYPSVVTISCANECRFLIGSYALRHEGKK